MHEFEFGMQGRDAAKGGLFDRRCLVMSRVLSCPALVVLVGCVASGAVDAQAREGDTVNALNLSSSLIPPVGDSFAGHDVEDGEPSSVSEVAPAVLGGVWIQPIPTAVLALSRFTPSNSLYLPIGGWARLNGGKDLTFELAPIVSGEFCEGCTGYRGGWTSVGLSMHSSSRGGAFLQPKFQFAWFEEGYGDFHLDGKKTVLFVWSSRFHANEYVGVDVGYQYVSGVRSIWPS